MNDVSPPAAHTSPNTGPSSTSPSTHHVAAIAPDSNASQEDCRFRDHRNRFLDDLIRSLDIVWYAEISALYYMEYALSFKKVLLAHT